MEKSLHYPAGRDRQRAFEKKPRRGADMVALYTVWYNFVRQHKTLRCSPAMAAGLSATPWSMEDVVKLIDAQATKPARPNVYKTRNSN
jgi:hypothetical protein